LATLSRQRLLLGDAVDVAAADPATA